MTAEELVTFYGLQPHPEGGFFKEQYRSAGTIAQSALPDAFTGERNFSTAIYFLLKAGQFSACHRIKSDELWHFYTGTDLNIYVIHPGGTLETIRLGSNITKGAVFQAVVPAGCWFASEPAEQEGFSLVGCTVSPGFAFDDFELAKKAELISAFPQHEALINRLCRS